MTMHRRYIHDTQRYKTSECTEYNGRNTFEIHERYIKTKDDTSKIYGLGGNRPHFGGESGPDPLASALSVAKSGGKEVSHIEKNSDLGT